MEAYTYTVKQKTTGKIYYGVRKSKIFDLGITYFTSSKIVKRIILEQGVDAFEFKLRRGFESYEAARRHESSILSRLNAVKNEKMFNQAVSSPMIPNKDEQAELKRRKKISESLKEKWKNDVEYKNNSSFNKISREERVRRGKLCAEKKRQKRRENGELQPKKRYDPKKEWKTVQIVREGVIKTIKQNQISAYKKCGWEMSQPHFS